jgi:hypothetical protein
MMEFYLNAKKEMVMLVVFVYRSFFTLANALYVVHIDSYFVNKLEIIHIGGLTS